jgi:hypothetical protein
MTSAAELYGFGPVVPEKSNVDFNNLTDNGIFYVQDTGTTNGPKADGASGGLVQVIKSTSYTRQVWRSYNSLEVWERYLLSGTWSAWERTYISGFNLSEAAGYQKLPSGLIVQWGFYSGGAASPVTITFPEPFPNACLNVQLTPSSAAAITIVCGTKTASNVAVLRFTTAEADSTADFYWHATGY